MRDLEVIVNEEFMTSVEYDSINSLDLRSDIENNNIFGCTLLAMGYVGNRPDGAIPFTSQCALRTGPRPSKHITYSDSGS